MFNRKVMIKTGRKTHLKRFSASFYLVLLSNMRYSPQPCGSSAFTDHSLPVTESFTNSIFVLRCFMVCTLNWPMFMASLSCGKRW